MVFDTFTFFNELELLELRLNELSSVVDYFLLVESTKTFQGQPKPLVYAANIVRFKSFWDKIIYVPIDPPDSIVNPWDMEFYQRDQVGVAVKDLDRPPDDIILLSDLDEIPHPEAIDRHKKERRPLMYQHYLSYYYLNTRCRQMWTSWNTRQVRVKDFTGGQSVRQMVPAFRSDGKIGWHFSYCGGPDRIRYKIESFAHNEYNNDQFKPEEKLAAIIAKGGDIFHRDFNYDKVPVDDSFPLYVRANLAKFKPFLCA